MRRPLIIGLGLLTVASTAQAFPWDIDMTDAYFMRAFEWKMMPLPEGTISTNRHAPNGNRITAEGQAMQNPYEQSDDHLATGKKMFGVYCAACHGVDGKQGAPVADNNPAENRKRYMIPPPALSGANNVSALRSDGYLYLTIRNGGAIMPAYGYAMEDEELWSIVSYIRTLDGAKAPAAN